MGLDISSSLVVGWFFNLEEFWKKNVKHEDAVGHWEKRFNKKTGEELKEQEWVEDKPARNFVEFNGFSFEEGEEDELCDAIADVVACLHLKYGDLRFGDDERHAFSLASKSDDIGFEDMKKAMKKAKSAQAKFKILGIKLGSPEVFSVYDAG